MFDFQPQELSGSGSSAKVYFTANPNTVIRETRTASTDDWLLFARYIFEKNPRYSILPKIKWVYINPETDTAWAEIERLEPLSITQLYYLRGREYYTFRDGLRSSRMPPVTKGLLQDMQEFFPNHVFDDHHGNWMKRPYTNQLVLIDPIHRGGHQTELSEKEFPKEFFQAPTLSFQ